MVFSALQLSWFTTEQAWAVTEEQWVELSSEQKLAVQRARYEGDVLLELRGVHTNICIVLSFTLEQVFTTLFTDNIRIFCYLIFHFEVVL